MKNLELSEIFYQIADILEIKNIEWKPRAYRKAARNIETLTKNIQEIYDKGGLKALEKIQGVGEHIAKKIEEYLKTGKIKEYEKLKKELPKGFEQIVKIQGMGPKKAIKLYEKLKISNVKQLLHAAKKGKIQELEGFGEKSQEDIIRGISLYEKIKGRMLLGQALYLARELKQKLEATGKADQVEIAGSIRRMKETIGDIDVLAISKKPKELIEEFVKFSDVKNVLAKGPTKCTVILSSGIQADLRVLEKDSFGSGMNYFTGNKDHNVQLRKLAIKKGYKLSEYGLFKGNLRIAGKTEEEIYKKLGMQYMPPEIRQNKGEIEAAARNKIPRFIELSDIKGDLQMHTNWSDGNNSIEEMAKAAKQMGYKYIAITDHSKSEYQAKGMDEEKLKNYLRAIDKTQEKIKGLTILKGCEVDILKDGSLDYEDKTLKRLDFVLAAVHSGFKMNQKEMTDRICKALQNKYVNALAHPTGRIIGQRDSYNVDLNRVIDIAKENKIALEIDSSPNRLDLSDNNARLAAEKGVMITINTDAHDKEQLRYIELGVATARRAWIKKEQVINTKTLSELKKFLKKR